MDTTALDRQIGDLVWCFYNGLRASYSILQVFDMLRQEAPEPARGSSASFFDDLCKSIPGADALLNWNAVGPSLLSLPLVEPLERWKQAYPSPYIAKVAEKILEYQQKGGHLADMLEPLEAEFVRKSGSDPAFYEAMRREAKDIGAKLPERVKVTNLS